MITSFTWLMMGGIPLYVFKKTNTKIPMESRLIYKTLLLCGLLSLPVTTTFYFLDMILLETIVVVIVTSILVIVALKVVRKLYETP